MPTALIALDDDDDNGHGKSFKSFEFKAGETFYEGLERQGKVLPHGCLAGACGACRLVILEGAENLDEPGPIEKNTLDSICRGTPHAEGKTIRLGCRAKVLKGSVKAIPFK